MYGCDEIYRIIDDQVTGIGPLKCAKYTGQQEGQGEWMEGHSTGPNGKVHCPSQSFQGRIIRNPATASLPPLQPAALCVGGWIVWPPLLHGWRVRRWRHDHIYDESNVFNAQNVDIFQRCKNYFLWLFCCFVLVEISTLHIGRLHHAETSYQSNNGWFSITCLFESIFSHKPTGRAFKKLSLIAVGRLYATRAKIEVSRKQTTIFGWQVFQSKDLLHPKGMHYGDVDTYHQLQSVLSFMARS